MLHISLEMLFLASNVQIKEMDVVIQRKGYVTYLTTNWAVSWWNNTNLKN